MPDKPAIYIENKVSIATLVPKSCTDQCNW